MNALTQPIISRMTRDEFMLWDAPAPHRWQLIDGEASEMAPTTEYHGVIQAELARLIGNHLAETRNDCRVIDSPGVIPRVRGDMNYRIPDLGVSCSPISGGGIVEYPVILAEILSPSNEAETRANVWAYTTIPSVREILLLRSSRIEAELLCRDPDGNWPANPIPLGPDATLTLDSLGFTVALAAIYRTTGLQR